MSLLYKKTGEYYNQYWNSNEWKPKPILSLKKRKGFNKFIDKDKVVLDVGCGDGEHYGKYILSLTKEYYGIDVSLSSVENAKKLGIKAILHNLEEEFPFENSFFDVVITFDILEHLFDPEVVLNECQRVLKKDGILIVNIPNIVHIENRLQFLFGKFNPGGSPLTNWDRPWVDPHIRFFTKKIIIKLLKKIGFQIVEFLPEGNNFVILEIILPSLFSSCFLIVCRKR